MSNVFVVDTYQKSLDPVHPGRARMLLSQGKAAVWRRFPFTIILFKVVEHPQVQPLRLKIDPGSQTTGIALVNDASGEVVFAAELTHRGQQIKKDLDTRRAVRRNRRARKTRYRKARFQNRRRPAGWLAPSLQSRVGNIMTWVERLSRYAPVAAISQELVRFDMQIIENPAIEGKAYQQGTLAGYEVREFLLEKWDRTCAYCSKTDLPLQVEHIQPRAKGGSNRISNLILACEKCNIAKGTQDLTMFLQKKPDLLKRLQSQAKAPLRDAAAVNTTRWALFERLKKTGLPIEVGSGGLTKYNRSLRALPKTHWLDASCVGKSTPDVLHVEKVVPLLITATGHGCRRMRNVNDIGLPCSKSKGAKKIQGFQTGDMVRAIVTTGKKQGTYTGRVLVRSTGSFDLTTKTGRVAGLNVRFFSHLHTSDGYSYAKGSGHSSPA
jgi:5-methylcytosine-specific restriction endonuclease McrA